MPSSEENPEYRPCEDHEFEIDSVYIVLIGQKQVGAYRIQYENNGDFYRLFWVAAIKNINGVVSFVMKEIKLLAKQKQCKTIKLSVNLSNINAVKCYVKNVFLFEKEYCQEIEMKVDV